MPARLYAQPGTVSAPAPDGPDLPLTLPEAVYLGLRLNPAVRSAYLQRVLDRFNLRVSEALFEPKGTLVATLNTDRTGTAKNAATSATPTVQLLTPLGTAINFGWDLRHRASRQPGSGGRSGGSALTLTVIQPLLKGAGTDVGMAPVQQARLQERYNQLRLKATVAATVTEIIQSYHLFLQTGQQVVLARAALKRAQDLETINQALIRAGRMAPMEITQVRSTLVNQELNVVTAESGFDGARLRLLTVLGLDLRTRIRPTDTLTAESVAIDLEAARRMAFDNRPDYLSQMIAIESDRIGVRIARNQRLWDVALTLGLSVPGSGRSGREAAANLPDTRTDLRAGLQVIIPFNDLSLERQEVQATIGLRQSEAHLEQIRSQVDQQVRDGIRTVHAAWRQYQLSNKAKELVAQTLETEIIKLRAGRSTNFQVVSFQDQLRLAENAALTALIAYLDALVALDQQVGTTLDTWRIELNDTAPP